MSQSITVRYEWKDLPWKKIQVKVFKLQQRIYRTSLNWTFGNDSLVLPKHSNTTITRHIKVRGDASPFDGNWADWGSRKGEYPGIKKLVSITIKRQKGKCAKCGLNFLPEDLVEIHYKNGNHKDNRRDNLVALHLHCHDQIHGDQGNLINESQVPMTKVNLKRSRMKGKLSCPVLKPSMGGDSHA